jgi:hypothetical protein
MEHYNSKTEVLKKLAQAKYDRKKLAKFKNRIFVKHGLDGQTGTYPLGVEFSSFLSHARSVLQYAHKEAGAKTMTSVYDRFLSGSPILRFFRDLRDVDIHESTLGAQQEINISAPLVNYDPLTRRATSAPVSVFVESLDDLDKPPKGNQDINIITRITQRIEVTPELITQFETEGRADLAGAARRGEPLYELLECGGEKDLFRLCDNCLEQLDRFVEFGIKEGFIT